MNQNMLLIALLVGALFFMRRPTGSQRPVKGQWETAINGGATGVPGIPGTTGMYGEG
jgi:hypothetical protein